MELIIILWRSRERFWNLKRDLSQGQTGRCDSADCSGFKPDCKRSFTDCGCKASGWFQSQCGTLSGCVKWSDCDNSKISEREYHNGAACTVGAVGPELVPFLKRLMEAKYNIFISGGTGSGKTTFLNALSDFIPKDERIITIEDNAELRIKNVPNLVRLEARNANVEGTGEISIRDLIKSALRMRPTRIIVGEVRGSEAIDMLQSLNTGHCGASSGHSNSPEDMLSRLETMVLMGMDIPLTAIQRQIASAIDIIIHLGRLRDRSRKLLQIVEVLGYEDGKIQLQTLYEFQETEMIGGKIKGEWVKLHEIQKKEKLLAAGHSQA